MARGAGWLVRTRDVWEKEAGEDREADERRMCPGWEEGMHREAKPACLGEYHTQRKGSIS